METAEKERNYAAFISYRHKPVDREAAIAVQKKIEHFKVPAQYRQQVGGSRIGYCFRDEDELPASSSLSDSIRYALDHADYLIVICTPDLPKSKWCEEEIRYFLSTHDRDHVLAVLAWGEPEESFSPLLTHVYDEEGNVVREVEPLAANVVGTERHISKAKFRKESIRICAALIGCPFDELWQRERRYRTRRLAALGGIVVAGLSIFAGVVTVKNVQIRKQNLELKTHEGRLLIDGGTLLLDGKDPDAAAENAVQALGISEIHTEGAEKLLADARGAYTQETLRYSTLVSQESAVISYEVSADGEFVYTADQYGVVHSFDSNGEERWGVSAVQPENRVAYMDKGYQTQIMEVLDGRAVLCGNAYQVLCLSAEDGSVLWEMDKKETVDFLAVSEDRSKFAVFDAQGNDEVSVCSVEDGSVLVRLGFPKPHKEYSYFYNLSASTLTCNFGGCFTKDGRYFLFAVGAQEGWNVPEHDSAAWNAGNLSDWLVRNTGAAEDVESSRKRNALMVYCGIDTEEKTGWMAGKEEIEFGFNPVYGMDYDPQTDTLFFARRDEVEGSVAAGVIDAEGNFSYPMSIDNIAMYRREVPRFYLEGNRTRVVCASDEIYILSREDNTYAGRYEIGEQIVGAWWLDREEDILFIVQKDGTYHVYPLVNTGTIYTINDRMQTGELNSATGIGGGFFTWVPGKGTEADPDGACLYVASAAPGKVIRTELFTDPHVKRILSDYDYNGLSKAKVTSDGSRLIVIQYDVVGNGTAQVMDLESLEVLGDLSLEEAESIVSEDSREWEIPEEWSEVPGAILRAGDASRCFAAIEEDGVLRIYDMGGSGAKTETPSEKETPSGEETSLRLEITDPEKFAGSVSIAFAAHDRYLCWLSYSGEFRIYDAASGECVLREVNPLFATEYGTTELFTDLTADETKLIVRATETGSEMRSNGSLYSLQGFEQLAKIPNLAAFSGKTDTLVLFRQSFAVKTYSLCPLYSAQDLVEWK